MAELDEIVLCLDGMFPGSHDILYGVIVGQYNGVQQLHPYLHWLDVIKTKVDTLLDHPGIDLDIFDVL